MSKTRHRPLYAEVVAHNKSLLASISAQAQAEEMLKRAVNMWRTGKENAERDLTRARLSIKELESEAHPLKSALSGCSNDNVKLRARIKDLENAGKTYAANGNENAQGASGLYYTKGGG